MARFIADRINAIMNQPDYIDLAPYGIYKSLRLYNCPKVALNGEVNANSRYTLPEKSEPYEFMMTNTMGCIFINTPLHIQQEFPIDPIYQHGLN